MREILKSKIHRACLTGVNPSYVGSIIIDKELMAKVDLIQYEKVLVCDVTNGNRWETYVLEGGAGKVEVQGAAANLCKPGDIVIIMSFEITDKEPKPKMIFVDDKNAFVRDL